MACDLNLGDDERQILASAGAMLEAQYPIARKRGGAQDDLGELAAFGLLGLALANASGDAGYSVVEEALLHVLLGRHLVSTGALAAVVGARLAAGAGEGDLAAAIVAGERVVCAAIPAADSVLLIERGDARLALLFGDRNLALVGIEGLDAEPMAALGHATPLQRVSASGPRPLASSEDTGTLDTADLLVAAQLLGVAEAARDLAVDYAKLRHQFGQPIGGFQAIKHHCANMAVAGEMVSAQLDMAAITLRDGRADASFQVAAMRRLAEQAALFNTRTAVQVHGGIGFSAEADVHHYLKQAHLLSRLGKGADMLSMPAPLASYVTIAVGG